MNIEDTDKRLKILGTDEIEAMYGRPTFTHEDRPLYFSLSPKEKAAVFQFHSIRSRIYFILQLGYFKVRHQFFIFHTQEVQEDAQYIQETYFPNIEFVNFELGKSARLRQQKMLLTLFDYNLCDTQDREKLEARARSLVRLCSKPIYIFRELVHYLESQRLILPKYTSMQDLIGKILNYEQNRLMELARSFLAEESIIQLNKLLDNPDGLYEITRLKREPKDFSTKEIACELKRGEQIQFLYAEAKRLLPDLGISNESVKYYASLIDYYSVYQLHQLTNEYLVYVYLLCFVFHRYQRFHDNLIACLLFHVKGYTAEAKNVAKERIYEMRLENYRNLPKAGQVLKLFENENIPSDTSYQEIKQRAFEILEPPKLASVADHLIQNPQFDETALQWEHIDQMGFCFKRRLRPLLLGIELSSTSSNECLFKAVRFLKESFQKKKPLTHHFCKDFPDQFMPEKARRYLYFQEEGERHLFVDRYEFLVYRCLHDRIEAGDIFCRESIRFRSFEDDLIDDQKWKERDELLVTTGLTVLQEIAQEHLTSLEQVLEERLITVNQRILSGENKHIKLKKRGQKVSWTLPYSRADEGVNHYFFDALKPVDIQAVLDFVDKNCQFMNAFTHVLDRYAGQQLDRTAITACLVAWGTNMGLGKMGETSNIKYTTLADTSNNYIRLETLQKANERICNAMAKLPVFQYYHLGETIHSSSDGQKFETANTINARHSPKYFGLKKGVVSYTLVANHIPINAKIIGANEHESHYVFDLLFNNTTEVQPTIHSTDTHGTNEVNFALLHFFGYQFAPRYRNVREKIQEGLYGFKHPSQYEELILKPKRKLKTNLITDEWENFQRILLSLALKTTTQHIIVSKLSAYARKNRTRRALWEYDNIIRSIYLLNYVDILTLRRNVQNALNRGENYHKLRKAVSYANFGRLRFKTEQEQQIWNECSRLLANCIIFYNATLLSELLLLKEQRGESEEVALFKGISPVAWQHINFHGWYEFTPVPETIDMSAIARELAALPVKKNSL